MEIMCSSMFNLLRNSQPVFNSGYPISHPQQQCMEFQFPHTPTNTWYLTFFNYSFLGDVKVCMKEKVESEKVGLKLNIQKTNIMASGSITSWEID